MARPGKHREKNARQKKCPSCRRILSGCCSCICTCVAFVLYLVLLWNLQRSYFWNWAYEWETTCEYPPLPANQSGIKVLVAGFAKTGTWAMTTHLHDIFKNSYHSEEFSVHVFNRIAHEYWARPENGGQRPRIRHPFLFDRYADEEERRTGVRPLTDLHHMAKHGWSSPNESERWPDDDLRVLRDLSSEKLADRVSRCRVDTVAFDGVENLFLPLLEVSRDAKVLLLDWRSYESWKNSTNDFGFRFFTLQFCTHLIWSGAHGLPWGFLIKRLVDPLTGGYIDENLRTGRAFLQDKYHVPLQLWIALVYQNTIHPRWWAGLSKAMAGKEEYDGWYREVERRTPPERLMHWNFKKHGWEDLCRFLEVEPCPKSGPFDFVPNVNHWDKVPFEEVQEPVMIAPLFLFFHWVNWKVYKAILTSPCRLLRCCFRKGKAD